MLQESSETQETLDCDDLFANLANIFGGDDLPLNKEALLQALKHYWDSYIKNEWSGKTYDQNTLITFLLAYCQDPNYDAQLTGVFVTLFFVNIGVVTDLPGFIQLLESYDQIKESDLIYILNESILSVSYHHRYSTTQSTSVFEYNHTYNSLLVHQFGIGSDRVKNEWEARNYLYKIFIKALLPTNKLYNLKNNKNHFMARIHFFCSMPAMVKSVYGLVAAFEIQGMLQNIWLNKAPADYPTTHYFKTLSDPDISKMMTPNEISQYSQDNMTNDDLNGRLIAASRTFNITVASRQYTVGNISNLLIYDCHPFAMFVYACVQDNALAIIPEALENHYTADEIKALYETPIVGYKGEMVVVRNLVKSIGRATECFFDHMKTLGIIKASESNEKVFLHFKSVYPEFEKFHTTGEGPFSGYADNKVGQYIIKNALLRPQYHVTNAKYHIELQGELRPADSGFHLPTNRAKVVYTTHKISGVHSSRANAPTICEITPSDKDLEKSFVTPYMSDELRQCWSFKGANGNYTDVAWHMTTACGDQGTSEIKLYFQCKHHNAEQNQAYYASHEFSAFDFFGKNVELYSVAILLKILMLIKGNHNGTFYDELLQQLDAGDTKKFNTMLNQAMRLILDGNGLAEGHFENPISVDRITFRRHLKSDTLPNMQFEAIRQGKRLDKAILDDPFYTDTAWRVAINAAILSNNTVVIIQILQHKEVGFRQVVQSLPKFYVLLDNLAYQHFLQQMTQVVFHNDSKYCYRKPSVLDSGVAFVFLNKEAREVFCKALVEELKLYQKINATIPENSIHTLIGAIRAELVNSYFDQTLQAYVKDQIKKILNKYNTIEKSNMLFLEKNQNEKTATADFNLHISILQHYISYGLSVLASFAMQYGVESVKPYLAKDRFYGLFLSQATEVSIRNFLGCFFKFAESDNMVRQHLVRCVFENSTSAYSLIFFEMLAEISGDIPCDKTVLTHCAAYRSQTIMISDDFQPAVIIYLHSMKVLCESMQDTQGLFYKFLCDMSQLGFSPTKKSTLLSKSRYFLNMITKKIPYCLMILHAQSRATNPKLTKFDIDVLNHISKNDLTDDFFKENGLFQDDMFVKQVLPFLLDKYPGSMVKRVSKQQENHKQTYFCMSIAKQLANAQQRISDDLINVIFKANNYSGSGKNKDQYINEFVTTLKCYLFIHLIQHRAIDVINQYQESIKALHEIKLLTPHFAKIFIACFDLALSFENGSDFALKLLGLSRDNVDLCSEDQSLVAQIVKIITPYFDVYEPAFRIALFRLANDAFCDIALIYRILSTYSCEDRILNDYELGFSGINAVMKANLDQTLMQDIFDLELITGSLEAQNAFLLNNEACKVYINSMFSNMPYGLYAVLVVCYKQLVRYLNHNKDFILDSDFFIRMGVEDAALKESDIFGNSMVTLFIINCISDIAAKKNIYHDGNRINLRALGQLLTALSKRYGMANHNEFLNEFLSKNRILLLEDNRQLAHFDGKVGLELFDSDLSYLVGLTPKELVIDNVSEFHHIFVRVFDLDSQSPGQIQEILLDFREIAEKLDFKYFRAISKAGTFQRQRFVDITLGNPADSNGLTETGLLIIYLCSRVNQDAKLKAFLDNTLFKYDSVRTYVSEAIKVPNVFNGLMTQAVIATITECLATSQSIKLKRSVLAAGFFDADSGSKKRMKSAGAAAAASSAAGVFPGAVF